jgi:hypothetical protein
VADLIANKMRFDHSRAIGEHSMAPNSFLNESGFPAASSVSPYAGMVTGPLQAIMAMLTGDPVELLPSEAREKYRELEQRRGRSRHSHLRDFQGPATVADRHSAAQ